MAVLFLIAGGLAPASALAQATQPNPAAQPINITPVIASGHDVAVLRVEGMIYGYTLDSIKWRVDRARQGGATMIILEIDTYGGYVDSALEISKYLKALQGQVDTAAWINNKAYSAGILIAAACQQIVMSPASATGDCAPIMPGQNLSPTERAKAYAPIRTEFEDSARRHGYDFSIFDAMCRLGVELYLIQHKTTGQRRVVNQADYAVMVRGQDPPQPNAQNPFESVTTYYADPSVDRAQWQPVTKLSSGRTIPDGRIHDGTGLFTPSQTLAGDIGLSKAEVADLPTLQTHFNANAIARVQSHWTVLVAYFLTHPIAKGLLVLCLFVGGYLELQTPGLGIFGAIAVTAAVALFGAPFLVGLADWWHILLFVLGVGLLIAEITVTPSFGAIGVIGILCMLAGIALTNVPGFSQGTGPIRYSVPTAWDRLFVSTAFLLGSSILSIVAIGFLAHYFQRVPFFNRFILANPDGTAAAQPPAAATVEPREDPYATIPVATISPGLTGRATTPLHPAGRATFPKLGEDIDVISSGALIDPGEAVQIVEVAGNRVVVERL